MSSELHALGSLPEGKFSQNPPDRRLRVHHGLSVRFGETKSLSAVKNRTTIHGCPCTLEKAADRYFLTAFDDILFSTIEVNVASNDIYKRWWIFQVISLMFLSFWLYSRQISWWKSRLLIRLARYSVFLRIFSYRISSSGSASCSVIVLPHTSLWIPQSFARLSLNEQMPVAFMKRNCGLLSFIHTNSCTFSYNYVSVF